MRAAGRQPGPQFHYRQGPGGGDDRYRLVQGQGLERAAYLTSPPAYNRLACPGQTYPGHASPD